MLMLLGLPTLAGFRSDGDRQLCLSNFRQLTRAWLLYAENNAGRLPGNLDGGDSQNLGNTNRTWAVGWLDFTTRSDNTNTLILAQSQIGPYLSSPSVFRCPADPSVTRSPGGPSRVRSVSMNSYVGQRGGPYTTGYRQFTALTSMVDPRPSECLVFIEEREDSINDGCFFIDMSSFDPARPTANVLVDFPSARHDGAGSMSFADGHVESWVWLDPRTRPVLRQGLSLPLGQPHPNSPDVTRIQKAASRRTSSLP